MEMMIAMLIGLLAGFFLGWFAFKRQETSSLPVQPGNTAPLEAVLARAQEDLKEKQLECQELTHELAKAEQRLTDALDRYRTREQEVTELQERFRQEFSLLAEKLLEEKGKRLGDQQNAQLATLLQPLQEKLSAFDNRIALAQVEETKQRTSLGEKIQQLTDLNQQMVEDARRLTEALKGSSKVQGNWGELVLERILEKSGLQLGREYQTQKAFKDESDRRFLPDAVIYLPEQRHLIVDSKVSLTAYERYVSADDPTEKEKHRRDHLLSLRNHYKSLGEKNYPALAELKSPEFVFMFVAVEPAFQLALQSDGDLLAEAFGQKVILVGPSTLLAATSTVASIWRHERQNRNVIEIAKVGGELVDKLVGFIGDLEQVRKALGNAEKSLDAAHKKLHDGKGTILSKAKKLELLGAKSSKQLPPAADAAFDDDDTEEDAPVEP
jgi:DNA recombination protein RmuC